LDSIFFFYFQVGIKHGVVMYIITSKVYILNKATYIRTLPLWFSFIYYEGTFEGNSLLS